MCDCTVKDVEKLEYYSLYQRLVMQQEPLGKQFDKILHDNLWDLMVKDETSKVVLREACGV